ncbi:alpha/beta fold hydrolase [Cellulomonas sp. URHD0024]|uniref:alpha/beta fold hydrolase n=1 Tax=Cellulomonas sp. URHD0024 TaxID=1302620 RepID=UPI00054CFB25|nr:alpha/beta hydrolase [Cellulomonas sp. URHD0024]
MNEAIALIPGAGGQGWLWHLVEADLRARGFDAVAMDLPAADPACGLPAYADTVVAAIGDRTDVTLVAQSMGGFTAPLVWQRVPTRGVVFVNAMIPVPGETPGDWWGHVGSHDALVAAAHERGYTTEFDDDVYFYHDVPPDLVAFMKANPSPETDTVFGDPCTFTSWPSEITVVAGRDDRLFPLELQQRVARERVGREPVVVRGGHLAALSHPAELADAIAGSIGRAGR